MHEHKFVLVYHLSLTLLALLPLQGAQVSSSLPPLPAPGTPAQAPATAATGTPSPPDGSFAGQLSLNGPDMNGPKLTLKEALDLAELYNPQIKAALAQTQGATSSGVTAAQYPNPTFNTWIGQQHSRPILTPAVPGLLQHYGGSQDIELPSVRRSRIEASRFNRESAQFGLAGVRREVRLTVKLTFFDVLRREEEIRHAQENLQLVQDLRRRTEVQVSVGEAAKLELTRAEAEIARAQTIVKTARIEYIAALAALRAAVSAPLPDNITPSGALNGPVTLPSLDIVRKQLIETHPVLRQARAEVSRAEAVIRNEKAQRYPTPTVNGEYEEQPDLGYYRLGFQIPLPLWNRRKGQIGEAEALLQQMLALQEQRRLQLVSSTERAYGLYQVANQQVVTYQQSALREAEAALRAAEAAYRFGERGILEVLDAQRVLQGVRSDYLDAQWQRQSALIELEQLGAVTLEVGK